MRVRLGWPPFIFICVKDRKKQIVLSVFRSKLSDENSFQTTMADEEFTEAQIRKFSKGRLVRELETMEKK